MWRMQIGDEEVLTIAQAAERIGVSSNTLYSQIQREKIQARRFGRQWMLTAGEVRRYIEETRGKQGFAAPSHPLHGRGGPGRRRKKVEETPVSTQ
jgi:excisionase family DNA binding protein